MSTDLKTEYARQKYGSSGYSVADETLTNDLQFWEFLEVKLTEKRQRAKRELDERLAVQNGRAVELAQLSATRKHFESNGLTRKDEELEPIISRMECLESCLKMDGIETGLREELTNIDEALANAKLQARRLRFKIELAQQKAGAAPQSKVKAK
jgi:hypothetical protein